MENVSSVQDDIVLVIASTEELTISHSISECFLILVRFVFGGVSIVQCLHNPLYYVI